MSYCLMVEVSKGKYQPLDITKSKYFKKISKSSNYTIEEIDLFTMHFKDLNNLRLSLINESILPTTYELKNLSLRINKENEQEKIPYDFLYQNSLVYYLDPKKLISYLEKELNLHNYDIWYKLTDYFYKSYEVSTTLHEVRNALLDSKRNNYKSKYFYEKDKDGNTLSKRFLKLLIYKNNKVNYRNLHEILAFINNYHKKEEKTKVITPKVEENSEITLFSLPSKTKTYKKY